ncbi:hypothetical protein B7R23_09155 [Subtercola boreus]|nr:hypothetical protein B7R24_09220 [Subtercola boreus]RFA20715.1 hypothetical protein B7R23_09155 [Subtercola boreus]
MHGASFYVGLAPYAIAIGVASTLPWVSLAIVFTMPALQFIGLLEPPEATSWPVAGASILVAFLVTLSARTLVTWVGLLVVLLHAMVVGIQLAVAVADGARFLREAKPETTDTALREFADTARSALLDLRGLIEGLRDEAVNRPQPTLADLPALTGRLAAAGMTIETEQFGTPELLTPSRQVVVYRTIQESLTNALRHSGAHPAAVITFSWEGPGLALSITSTGDAQAPDPAAGGSSS